MRLSYPYEKALIGRLIGYYRKKNHISQRTFLLQINAQTSVCSLKTLSKIEKGEIAKNEKFYEILCNALGKQYQLEYRFIHKLEGYRNSLKRCLGDYSKSSMKKLLKQISKDLEIFHHTIYIYEMLLLYHTILQLYMNDTFPCTTHLDIFAFLKENICEEDKKIILLLFYKCSVLNTECFNMKELYEECAAYEDEELFFDFHLSAVCRNYRLLEAYHILSDISQSRFDSLSDYQKSALLNSIALLELKGNDMPCAAATMIKSFNYLHSDFCEPLLSVMHTRMGILSYAMNDFEKSIECFTECARINLSYLNHNFILFFHALEIMNRQEDLKYFLFHTDFSMIQDSLAEKIIGYYRLKYGSLEAKDNISKLEEYICENLKPLCVYQELYEKVLLNEMMELIFKTGNYKNLYLFMIS